MSNRLLRNKIFFIFMNIFLIFILLSNIPDVKADQAKIEFNIAESRTLVTFELTLEKYGEIAFSLPEDAKAVSAVVDSKQAEVQVRYNKLRLNGTKFKVEYVTESFIERTRKNYFAASVTSPADASFQARIVLPAGAILDKPGTESIFPKDASISTDGQHITVELIQQAKQGEKLSYLVIYNEQNKNSYVWTIAIIIAIALALTIFLLIKKKVKIKAKPKPIKRAKRAKPELHLLESEKAAINALRKAKGELWQKQIQLTTGFSKAKLSRVIRDLEARRLIKKIPIGNTNKIKLIVKIK